MAFDAYDRSLDLLRTLVPLLPRLAAKDAGLEDQLRRAARNVHLNIAEGNRRRGADRSNRFRWALSEAAEVTAALDNALVFGYLDLEDIADALALADRVRAMTYRLANR